MHEILIDTSSFLKVGFILTANVCVFACMIDKRKVNVNSFQVDIYCRSTVLYTNWGPKITPGCLFSFCGGAVVGVDCAPVRVCVFRE